MKIRLCTAALFAGLTLAASPPALAVPVQFSLTDQTGVKRSEADFGDAYQLIFFGYTHCPDVCPTTLAEMAVIEQKLPERLRDRVKLIFISADPERDTSAVLKEYIGSFDNRIIGLTGDVKAIDALAWSMKVVVVRHGALGDPAYTVDHSTFYTIVHKGTSLGTIDYTAAPEEIIAKLETIVPK